MYKCNHCNEIIPEYESEGRIVKAGPKMYCAKCGEPVVQVPDVLSAGSALHGAQATLISNSDNRITTNNYYGGTADELIETPFGKYKRSETRLCKHCRQWVPLICFNSERGKCDNCVYQDNKKSFNEGKLFFETGLYDVALLEFLKYEDTCLKEERPELYSFIGRCYFEQKDFAKALKYFVIASNNNAESMYYLGLCYYNGYGVVQDYSKAANCFLESYNDNATIVAKKCNYDNYYYLGLCFFYGHGVTRDCIKAMKYFREANKNSNIKTISFLEKLELKSDADTMFRVANYDYGYKVNDVMVIPAKEWRYAYQFHDGLARVQNREEKWGFIDKTGFLKINYQWSDAGDFCNGLAKVWKGDWGYIDKEGQVIIPYKWCGARDFGVDGLADVKSRDGKWHKIDIKGNVVL